MGLVRVRRQNLVLLSTRAVPVTGMSPGPRVARRRRFRFVRTGTLLAVIGVLRATRTARSRWRISVGLGGVLLEVFGHTVCPGPIRGAADLLGLVVIIVAVLKSEGPAEARRAGLPQVSWHGRG
jgi:hypothetical protein